MWNFFIYLFNFGQILNLLHSGKVLVDATPSEIKGFHSKILQFMEREHRLIH